MSPLHDGRERRKGRPRAYWVDFKPTLYFKRNVVRADAGNMNIFIYTDRRKRRESTKMMGSNDRTEGDDCFPAGCHSLY